MKKWVLFCLIVGGLWAAHPNFDQPQSVENSDIFLSFMRTGTNWLFTCIQALTKKPLYYIEHGSGQNYSLRKGINHLKIPLNKSKKPLYHTHIFQLVNQLPRSNRLLLIIRNYKEVFIRRVRDDSAAYAKLIKGNRQFQAYCSYLKTYNAWDPNNRLLVYYEDLILKPRETLKAVLDFLEEDDQTLNSFMENFEAFRKITVESYHNVQKRRGGSMSKGNDVLFHSNQIPKDLLKKTDIKMQKNYPQLWEMYLKRYETAD